MVSADFLQKKIKEYAASKTGKAKIKKQTGVDYDAKKDPLQRARVYAEKMKRLLYKHIHTVVNERGEKSLASITLDNIVLGEPRPYGKDSYKIVISLKDVSRESLWKDGYPDGVYDIVGLFYHGYSARGKVYGTWRNMDCVSRTSRDEDLFARNAVNEFNEKMKKMATAELSGEYAD